MNQVEITQPAEFTKEYTNLCHCEADISSIALANNLNLPLFGRTLMVPQCYGQNWGMFPLAYYGMFDCMKMYEGCMDMGYEGVPTLNQLATSHNTEEANSNCAR
jgi:hypothetical protein